ncbi:hypothetical protein B0H17DRAFT_1148546, partial [Mycena rosella]
PKTRSELRQINVREARNRKVRVEAAGFIPIDYKIYDYASYGRFIQKYLTVLGSEVAGEVTKLSPGVDNKFKRRQTEIPSNVDYDSASTFSANGNTTACIMYDDLKFKERWLCGKEHTRAKKSAFSVEARSAHTTHHCGNGSPPFPLRLFFDRELEPAAGATAMDPECRLLAARQLETFQYRNGKVFDAIEVMRGGVLWMSGSQVRFHVIPPLGRLARTQFSGGSVGRLPESGKGGEQQEMAGQAMAIIVRRGLFISGGQGGGRGCSRHIWCIFILNVEEVCAEDVEESHCSGWGGPDFALSPIKYCSNRCKGDTWAFLGTNWPRLDTKYYFEADLVVFESIKKGPRYSARWQATGVRNATPKPRQLPRQGASMRVNARQRRVNSAPIRVNTALVRVSPASPETSPACCK